MNKEYVIWGKSPKNPIHEDLLISQYKNKSIHDFDLAKKLEKTLIENHNCFDTRIQVLDLDNVDINKMFLNSINK